MFGNVFSAVHEDALFESLGLSVHLLMVCYCCQMFNTEEDAHYSNELTEDLSTNVSEDVSRDCVRVEQMNKENICNLRRYCVGVGNDKYILVFVLFWDKALQYPLRRSQVVQILERAAV